MLDSEPGYMTCADPLSWKSWLTIIVWEQLVQEAEDMNSGQKRYLNLGHNSVKKLAKAGELKGTAYSCLSAFWTYSSMALVVL